MFMRFSVSHTTNVDYQAHGGGRASLRCEGGAVFFAAFPDSRPPLGIVIYHINSSTHKFFTNRVRCSVVVNYVRK
jgi:hypothetical protein